MSFIILAGKVALLSTVHASCANGLRIPQVRVTGCTAVLGAVCVTATLSTKYQHSSGGLWFWAIFICVPQLAAIETGQVSAFEGGVAAARAHGAELSPLGAHAGKGGVADLPAARAPPQRRVLARRAQVVPRALPAAAAAGPLAPGAQQRQPQRPTLQVLPLEGGGRPGGVPGLAEVHVHDPRGPPGVPPGGALHLLHGAMRLESLSDGPLRGGVGQVAHLDQSFVFNLIFSFFDRLLHLSFFLFLL
mmetsp:Transcript_38275/g.66440  ORF Transcript_38275/g.66440 Transcript_38275/m.66440 type:complete len:247 (-) Transcript_38275:139-879(-)